MIVDLHRTVGAAILTDDITTEVKLGALTRLAINDAVQIERELLDGDIFPTLTTLMSHGETIELETLNIDKLIDMIGVTGQCLRGTDADYFRLYASTIKPCSPGLPSGSDNLRWQLTGPASPSSVFGMMTPGSLSGNTGSNARMSMIVTPKSSDGNAAISVAGGQTIPAGLVDSEARFTLAEKCKVGNVDIFGKSAVNINFGVSLLTERADQDRAPSFVGIASAVPVIRITGPSIHWGLGTNIPRRGIACTHANTEIWFLKRDPSETSGFAALDEEVHIKITAAGKAFITQPYSATGNARGECVLEIYPERDASGNAAIIIDTTAAPEPGV